MTTGKLIMGVDDQAANLAFMNSVLKTAGYNFVGAATGADCLGLVHRAPPHLILLDIQMPFMDGIETCKKLRAISELNQTPILFLTQRKTRNDLREGVAAGANDFIIRPCHPDTLLQRVNHWLGKRLGPAPG